MSNNWQTCPKCHGQGYVWFPPNLPMNPTMTGDGTPYECDICKGKKIINSANGLPPDEPKQIEAEKGKELPTDEEIDKQFPVDPEEIMDGLKMPSDFKHSQEIRDCLAPIVDSNYNKRFGAKWMRSKLQSLPKEPTPEKCEKCPFFKFYKEPTTKLRDEDIEAWVRVRYNYLPHVINTLSAMRELISDAIKAYCDGKISKP